MRLHNRQIKATFWTDPDLLQWPREKRWFYLGLVQLADDSGCLEDSPFAFKIHLYPSPLDTDITVERIVDWVAEMCLEGKLIFYDIGGKRYFFISNFHKHQTLDTPTPPSKASIPLPLWVAWVPGDTRKKSKYIVRDMSGTSTEHAPVELELKPEPEPDKKDIAAPEGACDYSIVPAEKPEEGGAQHDEGERPGNVGNDSEYSPDFERFWDNYPRRQEKRKAWRAWKARLSDKTKKTNPETMITAAGNYAESCKRLKTDKCFIKLPATFIGPDRHFEEFVNKEEVRQNGSVSNQIRSADDEIARVFNREAFEFKQTAL